MLTTLQVFANLQVFATFLFNLIVAFILFSYNFFSLHVIAISVLRKDWYTASES